MYRVLDLFAGIGGFSLGLERTGGFKTVAFCEIDDYARKVLRKHWPAVPIYQDVRELNAERLRTDGIECNVITGGFPCQDISVAGKGKGIEGERSGLWSEFSRLIGEIRPKYAIVENTPRLLSGDRGKWMGRVLGDLAEVGYDAEWHCIPASCVGTRHLRDRVFIFATPREMDNAYRFDSRSFFRSAPTEKWRVQDDTKRPCFGWGEWAREPGMARVVDGIPNRLDRLKCLGNAIVPQVVEVIGHAILKTESA